MAYISGNYGNWESRFHQYSLNKVDGTGVGSIWNSYVTEAYNYSGVNNPIFFNSLFVKWNREYQHKLFNYTRDYHYWTANIFVPMSGGTGIATGNFRITMDGNYRVTTDGGNRIVYPPTSGTVYSMNFSNPVNSQYIGILSAI